jgi:hypothetical protein
MTDAMSSCQDDALRRRPGPRPVRPITALEQWREKGLAPAAMLGTNRESGLKRPICAFPSTRTRARAI